MTEKKRSRQHEWQLKQQKEGKCCICGEPLFTKWNCKEHAEMQREKARARYRKKVGLDVNAPITETGRKRIEEATMIQFIHKGKIISRMPLNGTKAEQIMAARLIIAERLEVETREIEIKVERR